MRILHINVNYIVSALHQTMIEHLNRQGVENSVFVPTYDPSISIVDCREYVFLSKCFKKWDRLFFYGKQRKIISSALHTYDISRFDLIHAYTLFTDGNAAMELSKQYGIPYVVAIRNQDVNAFFKWKPQLRPLGIRIMRNADAVFFLSPVYRKTVIEQVVPKEYREEILAKSHIIPNGIDDFWHENVYHRNVDEAVERFGRKELRCIYVGGIDANKNTELTLKGLALLCKQGWDCSLTAIGKTVERRAYEQMCRYPAFHYVEPKKREELIHYYRQADIFVMPSHTETFGLVYAEAMSQGLPVLYTRGQGFDGQFPEGEVGYSVDDKNPAEVAEKIRCVIRDYAALSRCAVQGSNRFCWDELCAKYISIYQAILSDAAQTDRIPVL